MALRRPTGRSARAVLTLAVGLVALTCSPACDGDSMYRRDTRRSEAVARGRGRAAASRRGPAAGRGGTVENHGDSERHGGAARVVRPGFSDSRAAAKGRLLLARSGRQPAGAVLRVRGPADGPPAGRSAPGDPAESRQGDDPDVLERSGSRPVDADGIPDSDRGSRLRGRARGRDAVDLRFDDQWRLEKTAEGDVLHGVLQARLLEGGPRTISMVAGAVMYGPPAGHPMAGAVGLAEPRPIPEARIPVVAYMARCSGHAIGEIKQPYAFLVWVSEPGRRGPRGQLRPSATRTKQGTPPDLRVRAVLTRQGLREPGNVAGATRQQPPTYLAPAATQRCAAAPSTPAPPPPRVRVVPVPALAAVG